MTHRKSYHFVLVSLFIELCVKYFEKKDLCLKNYLNITVQMLSFPLYYMSIKYIDFSLSQTIRFVSFSSIHHPNEGFSQRSAPRLQCFLFYFGVLFVSMATNSITMHATSIFLFLSKSFL